MKGDKPTEPQGPQFPNSWMLATAILAVMLFASLAFQFSSGATGMAIGTQDAGSKAVSYLSNNFGVTAQLNKVNETNGLYAMDMTINGQPYLLYMSKDGKLMFPTVFSLTDTKQQAASTPTPAPTNLPKTAKPTVELFIMSECPYGLQAEKGILPVVNLLKDKIDFNIRFVYYAMHGEKEVKEELRQYCIQKDQRDKYLTYLDCYTKSGDYTKCMTGIDTTKLDSCTKSADSTFSVTANLNDKASWLSGQFPKFDIDKTLNEKYQVQGSPTLVINGVQSSAARDSASLLATICSAFNDKPTECSQALSSAAPSAGFGAGTGTSGGSCG